MRTSIALIKRDVSTLYLHYCPESSTFIPLIEILDSFVNDEDGKLDKDILTKRLTKTIFGKRLYVYFIFIDLMNAEENLLVMKLLAVCIFQAKSMDNGSAGVGINVTMTV